MLLDEKVESKSPSSYSLIQVNLHPDIASGNRSVASILCEPATIASQLDAAADEIAELISRHTNKLRFGDADAALMQFKVISGHR